MSHVPGPSTAPCFSTSKATENFARLCQLVMTICSDLFRDILSRYIRPADLRSKLDINRKKLEKIMNAQQKEQIYPSSGATTLTAKDLDISVMYILLRNICNIPKHRNGWGNPPLNADTSLAACIERIRIQRNLVTGHSSSGKMNDNVFQDHWDELKDSILEIERQLIGGDMYKRGVDDLLACDLNPSKVEKYMKQFKSMEARMDNEKKRLDNVEERLDNVEEQHLSTTRQIAVRLDNMEEKQLSTTKHTAARQDKMEEQLLSVISYMTDLFEEKGLSKHMQGRFAALKKMQENIFIKMPNTTFHLEHDDNKDKIFNDLHAACRKADEEMSRHIIQTNPDLLHSVDNDGWNAALYAVRGGNVNILQLLADNDVDVKHKSNNGRNILHLACVNSNLEMSRYIIQTYPDLLHSVDNHGYNVTLHAAIGGNIEILQLLADNDVDIKQKNNNGGNILHIACVNSNLEMSRYIIQTYPDLLHSVVNDRWNAALHAAKGGNVEILKLLAENEVDVKHKNNNGWNILHVACLHSNIEMSRYIIQTYPDLLHSVDNDRWNAALHAARGGNVEILKLLAENETDVKHKNNNGWDILNVACFSSNLEMSRYIIQTYPDLLHSVDNDRWNAALHAAGGGNVEILKLLAENEIDVKHKNNNGWNILHVACSYSNIEMSRYIIQTYNDLLHSVDNNRKNAALHAARGGNVEILKLLAENEVDVKHKNNEGWTILNVACFTSNTEMSRYIIQTYPDLLHSVDNDRWNAALHAAMGGNVEILKLLAENEIDVKHKNNNGWNILHVACLHSNIEMSCYIIQTNPDLLHSVDNYGWNTALHAAKGGNVEILKLLAENEVDVKHKSNYGWNILNVACFTSKTEMSRYIIQTYPDLLHSVANDGWNAALFAAGSRDVGILKLLGENEVDVKHKKNDECWNILNVACIYSNIEMSRYIIQTYPDLLHSVDNDGRNTALHAAMGGNVEILKLLAENEVDVKHKSKKGCNILNVACVNSNIEMSRYIIQTYDDLLHSVDNDGWNTALHAARGGNVEILKLLAENEVDVKHTNNNGWNILHVACQCSNLEMSRYIIQTYPDLLHSVDNNGYNATLHAAIGGNIEILQLLADNDVDIKQKNNNGGNILHIACVDSNLEISRYIIQTYPELLHNVDNDGWNTALHAARGENVEILKLLAENEIDVKHKNNNGWNILHVACLHSNIEMSRYIIQTNPDLLHSVDNDRWNAALHAARGGNVEILKLLAENETDVKHKNNNGWDILNVACFSSNLEMSRYIIQTYPDLLHSVDNDRWNAALHAAGGGNVEILKLLAENEIDVKHKNNEGWNILHVACSYSNIEMSRYIIQTYNDLLHSVDNNRRNAALHAARGGNVEILKLLAENEVDVKHKNNEGWTILNVACFTSNTEMSRYIIQTYPDLLHSVDNDRWNYALHAAMGGNVEILKLLAENEVDVKHKNNNGWNILHVACLHSNIEMSRYIIQTNPDLLHSVDNYGWNAALHAATGGNVEILKLLAENEVDVKHKSNYGWNILNVACFTSKTEMSRYIIQTYPDLLHSVANNGWNAALFAAGSRDVGILKLLAENEVDVKHKKNDECWNILNVACIYSNIEMSRYIIQTYPDLLHSVDNDGRNTALHAAMGGNVEILKLLAENEVDVKHKNNEGWNILNVACVNSNIEMSRYIIQTYDDLLHSVDNDGWNTALHAARGGNVEILKLLAENEVDVKHKSKKGCNILHAACEYSNLEMSRYIIQTYPELLHSVDDDGWNAALHAAKGGNVEILKLLAENEVDVKHTNNNGWNILHVACISSNLEMSRYIIQTYNDLLHSVDNNGWNTALHAAKGVNVEILKLLAENEADVKHKDNAGCNILQVACRASNFEMSRYIIQTYPDLLHSVDNDGWNAALYAAEVGNVEILQLLADNGVNVRHKNNYGRNILLVACVTSHIEMSRYIIQKYPELLHSEDNDGWNAAQHAAKEGNVEFLQLLADNVE